jgi:hypothetical protein
MRKKSILTGLVILTNRSNNSSFIDTVCYETYDRLLGLSLTPWSKRFAEEIPEVLSGLKKKEEEEEKDRKKGSQPSQALPAYTGIYDHPSFWPLSIEIKDNQLYFLVSNQEDIRLPLRHFHFDTFKTWDEDKITGTNIKVTFHLNALGEIDRLSMRLQSDAEEVFFKKMGGS